MTSGSGAGRAGRWLLAALAPAGGGAGAWRARPRGGGGGGWTRAVAVARPGARRGGFMASDSSRARVVLYGGLDSAGLLHDTWEYDGATWTQAVTRCSAST